MEVKKVATKTERMEAIKEYYRHKHTPKDKPDKKEIKKTAFYETDTDLYEQVIGPGFAIYNKDTHRISYQSKKEFPDFTLTPLNSKAVDTGLISLPTEATEYNTTEELLEEIKQFIHDYLDISDEMLQFASYYVLLSWIYDRVNTVCYLRALGDTGSGKTRYLDTIGKLCYKATSISGAATAAPIFRLLEVWKGTLIIDEADFGKSDTYADIIKILNTGFEKGKPVIRCSKDDPNDIEIHRVYGPKLLSSRYSYEDKALESRCLTERMQQTNRDIPINLNKQFYDRAQTLRNKLLMYRFNNYASINANEYELKIEGIEPRLRQATNSFSMLFKDNEVMKKQFEEFIHVYQADLVEERSTSLEGTVVLAINYYIEKGDEWIYSSKLTDFINDGIQNQKDKLNNKKIGLVLKSLGFNTQQKRVGGRNVRVLKFDEDLLKNVFTRYVPNYGGTDRISYFENVQQV